MGSRARRSSESPVHDALSLAVIDRHVPAMQRLGVSEVARSPRGFLPAYRAAGGDVRALSPAWRAKREGFIARHMAQVKERGEPLVDARGNPTRRHLALIAWAYSPVPEVVDSLARGSRAKPMALSSRGWIPAAPALPSTTLRWDQLPGDVRSDAFLLASIHDGGLRRPQGSTVLTVKILPIDDVWRLFREVFPGRDIGGNPAAPDAEDHWDERGPAHVVTLVNLLEAVFPDPAAATPGDVMQRWMREDRAVTYEEPAFDEDLDDVPSGHSTLASTVKTIGPPHAGMLLPPLVVDADGFVDGRHRTYAARLAGLRYVPVLDLSQLEKW